ncbi:MAG: C1 family peptidase [Bacteroidetes bacterium]|nr:C1 family peptidase [Fibrella sp.]
MRSLPWLIALIALLTRAAGAQPLPNTGLLLDDAGYQQLPYQPVLLKSPLPARVSYESYCPTVQAQGPYSTCVGFACGYYLRTIIEAKARRITSRPAIDKLAFSPGYLYEKAKSTRDYACTEGIQLTKVLAVMQQFGVSPFGAFPYPACGQQTSAADQAAARYRIAGYDRLFNVQELEPAKLKKLKQALADGSPVVVGLVIPASFYFTKKVWQAAPGDNPANPQLQGHALCVVGYDDALYGGAFRVVNSFGSSWADRGFCWITYRDMARFVRYGFTVRVG